MKKTFNSNIIVALSNSAVSKNYTTQNNRIPDKKSAYPTTAGGTAPQLINNMVNSDIHV